MPCRTDGVNLPRRKVTVGYVAANPRLPMDEIGHEPPVGSPLQFPGFFAAFSRKRSLNLRRAIFSPDRLQCSVNGHW